jgi:hypothetical protein
MPTLAPDAPDRAERPDPQRDARVSSSHPATSHPATPAECLDCIDDGMLAIEGCGSLFLFDLVHRRFQRLARGSDVRRAARYGRWLPLRELVLDADGTFTVEPAEGAGPRVRSHAHGLGCACNPEDA